MLEKAGYRIVQDPSTAEVLIVNTCGFIEDAKKESIDTILEMSGYKSGNCKKLVVTGCLPQRYKGELAKLMPEVDLFVGTGEYQNIVSLLEGLRSGERTILRTYESPQYIHNVSTPRKIATPKHAVYIKIAEGCFHGCSFCIIPKLRGRFRSRTITDIAKEASQLIDNGAKELNLIAQDTTSYGKDLKDGSSLSRLLKELSKIKGDFWIRVMYAYPTSITDELIDEIAGSSKICHYMDIPIQHISDKILKAMRRRESGKDIRKLISNLRFKIKDLTLRTSLIVGFPGETAKEFNELLKFVKEGHFNHLGVFTYSEEEGTYAAKLKDKIPQKIKEARREKIMQAQKKISLKYNKKLVGKTFKVLVDGSAIARSAGQAPEIDGITKFQGFSALVGEFANVEIVGASEYDLKGKICSSQNSTI